MLLFGAMNASDSSDVGALAAAIEHTVLRATATPRDIEQLCREALEHRFHGVCVNPLYVARAAELLAGSDVALVSVVGFPLGSDTVRNTAVAAAEVMRLGATEVDMVIPIGLALAGDWGAVHAAVHEVKSAIGHATLKVIVETGYFDRPQIIAAVRAALSGGADFLKTSTGFGPRGASIDDIESFRAGGATHIKASGGIKTAAFARQLLSAGAQRIGTSSGVAIIHGS